MHLIRKLIVSSILLLIPSIAIAIDPGSKLPITIESDSASLDDQSGVSVYTGSVVISQGLSRLEADKISVITRDRKITSIEAMGKPAHFVQQENSESPSTHGYGNSIIYISTDNTLKFSGDAKLVQHENSFSGEEIKYDIVKRAIRAKGDQSQGSRVKIHYYPQADEDTSSTSSNDESSQTPAEQNNTTSPDAE